MKHLQMQYLPRFDGAQIQHTLDAKSSNKLKFEFVVYVDLESEQLMLMVKDMKVVVKICIFKLELTWARDTRQGCTYANMQPVQ